MSIEYTIDIQLTELGFPDILQQQESSTTETRSRSPSALPSTRKRKLPHSEADPPRETSDIQQSKLPCNGTTPAQSVQDKHAAVCTELPGLSEPNLNAVETTGDSLHISREEAGQNGVSNGETTQAEENVVEDDSDDTEVSDVYDEDDVDEEEDSDQDTDSSHSAIYCCSICDLQLPSKFKLQDHMNLHTGARPYCCAECGKRFCQKNNYRIHLRTHAQTNRLVCRICLRGFTTQEELEDHLSRIHTEEQFYECDLCKRVFTRLKECESHVQLHKCMLDAVCKVCGRSFSSRKSLARHQKRTCHHNLKCTDCFKTFTKKNALLKHSFSHLGLLPYTCIRCHCHFRLAKLYRQHKCEPERIHCVACLREFLSQDDFKQHKKDTGCWGNQEPKGDEIRCLECGETFDNSEELKKHAGAHQRVLKCAECGKGFRSALLLMSHMGGHAGKSPCLCQSCGLGFPHQQNYDSHLKTCGQTPQPVRAPKKQQASKRSSASVQNHPQKNLSAIPDTSAPTNHVTAADSNKPATPAKESVHPELVMGGVSNGSGQSEGLWKLTLDKQPPPGAQLVLYLPVCSTQTNNLPISPAVSGYHGMNAPLGLQLTTPPDLVKDIKQDPGCKGPLDLSKKCNPSMSALSNIPCVKIKNETEEFEISGEANSDMSVKAAIAIVKTEEDKYAEIMQTEMDPSLRTSSGLIVNIKKEPDSYGLDLPEAGK